MVCRLTVAVVGGVLITAGCGLTLVGTTSDGSSASSGGVGADSSNGGDDSTPPSNSNIDSGPVGDDASLDGPQLPSDAGDDGPKMPGPLCPNNAALLACFAFEGNMTDDSPRHIVPESATNITFPNGREGMAVRLVETPSKSNIRLPLAGFNTPQITLEMWIHAVTLPSNRVVLFDMDARGGIVLRNDGALACSGPTGSATTTQKITTGKWVHIACTTDGNTMLAYFNGVLSATSGTAGLGTTSSSIGVGQDIPSGNDNFNGLIDNLRVWSNVRTATEIAAAANR